MNKTNIKESDFEPGYEDIYSSKPYIDFDIDQKRVLIHLLFVPKSERFKGVGKKIFYDFVNSLPKDAEYIRLKSANLGSGDTMPFWKSLGFSSAYNSECSDNLKILHLAINGFELPEVESVNDEERHYIFD